jgi:predicted DNA-binding transcriptional regulator AlpA
VPDLTAPTLEALRELTVVDVPTAGAALGMSRSTSYRAAERGYLPTIRLGDRRVVVPVARLIALLEGKAADDAA